MTRVMWHVCERPARIFCQVGLKVVEVVSQRLWDGGHDAVSREDGGRGILRHCSTLDEEVTTVYLSDCQYAAIEIAGQIASNCAGVSKSHISLNKPTK